MKRYIKSNCLKDTEKDNIKEQVVANIQLNKTASLEINAVNNETDDTLKQTGNDYMKIPATENEYSKLENCQRQIENQGDIENKINADEMKQNIISKYAKVILIWKIGGARGVIVIVVGYGHSNEFKSWTRLIAFHLALILLGKVWIRLFSLQLWVNSRTDWILQPWQGN